MNENNKANSEIKLKLKPETVEKIKKIDNSIMYWSVQLGQVSMRLREVEAQVANLYDFKKTAVLEDVKAQEIDIEDCEIVTSDSENVIVRKVKLNGAQDILTSLKNSGE